MSRSRVVPPAQPLTISQFLGRLLGQPNLALALSAFLIGLFGNVLASAFGDWQLWGVPGNLIILVLLALGVLVLYMVYRYQRPPRIAMVEGPPMGKAGLILLLSTFDPRARGTREEAEQRTTSARMALERIAQADDVATAEDYGMLLGSNLEPALRAIEYHWHEGTLRECWIVGTKDEQLGEQIVRGSAWSATVLERWFKHLHPDHIVRFAPPIAVSPRDYISLWNAVDEVFVSSPYRPEHVICDITGGLKLMSIGAALACIGSHRSMQYMATGRDWKGEPIPKGDMKPVLVDINPYLAAPTEV